MQDTAELAARMRLWGLTRREAAREVCLSYSAFNRKLRESRLSDSEYQRLSALVEARMFPRAASGAEGRHRRDGGSDTTAGGKHDSGRISG